MPVSEITPPIQVLAIDSAEKEYFAPPRSNHCKTSGVIYVTEYQNCPRNPSTESPSAGAHLFRPIPLTDCCSLFSAILNIRPKSVEKCGKIILNRLRDMKSLITISFIDATCNLADIATKHAANLPILDRFFTRCRFTISLLGRKCRKSDLSSTNKPRPRDELILIRAIIHIVLVICRGRYTQDREDKRIIPA